MFYAYYLENENISDVVNSWEQCQKLTKGKKARYKKFKNLDDAKKWLDEGAIYTPKVKENSTLFKDAIYFDSGTGRNGIPEVKVSDVYGDSLLPFIMPQDKINNYGNYFLSKNRTNNFGELTALFIALKYAIKYNINKICGDSELVIKYWSLGKFNKDNLDNDTVELITKVKNLRKDYENKGGNIIHISGDINPADLGFHK